ncbi:hypothetical protein Aph01nite_76800 [Acrocarpospora phusangensis]|uniref:Uncharacterized protein n=1 Tax=Acrocarpospora phusangensis TaxID=1070424 RepID=A0A919QKY2_9ACTN|nr:hypothetical protein [Acrocarpospora phusangensis]GIH29370.1 hypothetical protein Aph01nite_76800 [Acrocarpospora phusangensis]
MPTLLNESAQAIVDGSGTAIVRMAPQGEDWEVTRLSVKVSTRVNEAEANYYLTTICDDNRQEGTYSGSSGDTSDTKMFLNDGDPLFVVWTGADVGAIATVTLRGTKTTPIGGFRAAPAGGIR